MEPFTLAAAQLSSGTVQGSDQWAADLYAGRGAPMIRLLNERSGDRVKWENGPELPLISCRVSGAGFMLRRP